MDTDVVHAEGDSGSLGPDLSALAEELVAAARGRGVELTGPDGLLTGLTRRVLETALEVEMAEHLGHDRGERSGSGNWRNGASAKMVRTDVGEVRIAVPRDRAGTFAPAVVPKHSRRLGRFDEAVISLYAKGMTTGDIAAHLRRCTALRCPGSWSPRSPTLCSRRWGSGRTGPWPPATRSS